MTMPLVRSVRRAQRRLNSRNDSPIRVPPAQSLTASATRDSARSRSRSREQPRHPGQLRPEHERLRLHRRRRRQRLDEPQQQPRVALHRARDVAQDDDLARPLDRPPPDPVGELAAGREVPPEHRPRREQPAVVVELVAAGPAQLEARLEEVDEPLGVAQLGRRSSGRSRGGGAPRRRCTRRVRRCGRRCRPRRPTRRRRTSAAGCRRRSPPRPARRVLGRSGRRIVLGRLRRSRVVGGGVDGPSFGLAPAALAPPAVEDPVVDLAVVAAPDEDRRPGGPDRALVADVDERQGPGVVDRRAQVDRQAGRPQRPPEPDRLGEQPAAVDGIAAERRADDRGIEGWIAACMGSSSSGLRRATPPRRGSGATSRRGSGGCPPRT